MVQHPSGLYTDTPRNSTAGISAVHGATQGFGCCNCSLLLPGIYHVWVCSQALHVR
jgi:hypothetical protein